MIKTVSIHELCEQLDTDSQTVLIDVRAAEDFERAHVPGAFNLPPGSMPLKEIIAEWGREAEGKPIYFICQSGGLSQRVVEELECIGFSHAQCVAGGMVAWNALGLPIAEEEPFGEAVTLGIASWGRVIVSLLMLAGCGLGLAVHKGFFAIPVLMALEMFFSGLTGWSGLGSVFGRKKRAG